ncbi:MAG TPA: hypothetical protein VFU69_15280 [Ktedonobacterales bacterium]|nr:hypothetical protein [Ktedonobacterales bacterium]
MANPVPQSSQASSQEVELPEPADDNFYRNLSIAFLIGIVFLFGLFTLMLILLAGAPAS